MHFIGYKYMVVDLDLVTLFTSYPGICTFVLSPSCFASNMITANWAFNQRIGIILLSTPIFLEVLKQSILSTRFSLGSSMYANIIYPGESFHTFTFHTSKNIVSKHILNTNP